MRAVLQRVKAAAVHVAGDEVAKIGRGLLVLVGFARGDDQKTVEWMARKIVSLRVFEDEAGRMNLDLGAVGGDVLVVSQFTLYGDCNKGKRPSFGRSAPAEEAERLYDRFTDMIAVYAPGRVGKGVFQAHMEVSLVNDGPVTLEIEKEAT